MIKPGRRRGNTGKLSCLYSHFVHPEHRSKQITGLPNATP